MAHMTFGLQLSTALVALTSLSAIESTAVAAPMKIEAVVTTKEQIRLDFADETKHLLGMVRREGKATGQGPLAGTAVTEYGAKTVKKSVVGTGNADKDQVEMMVRRLLPGSLIRRSDAADALAVAICHAHHRASTLAWTARATARVGAIR